MIAGILDFGSLGLGNWAWRLAGITLLLLGNGLAWWGVAVLGARPTTGLAGDLVTEGPYRFTRNPIYLGMVLSLTGLAIAFGNLWLLTMLVPFVLVIRYGVIAREEAYLERKFGDAYRAYRARVRRWL